MCAVFVNALSVRIRVPDVLLTYLKFLPEKYYFKFQVVALMAEGKEHALAIGLTKMSAEEILTVNKANFGNLMKLKKRRD